MVVFLDKLKELGFNYATISDPIADRLQDKFIKTLCNHLELLSVFQQLKEHCMTQDIIVELLPENRSYHQRTNEIDYSGAENAKNGQMRIGKRRYGVMNR